MHCLWMNFPFFIVIVRRRVARTVLIASVGLTQARPNKSFLKLKKSAVTQSMTTEAKMTF